ncbi:hypothetical protein PJN34_23320 [Mycobacterium kansasii]
MTSPRDGGGAPKDASTTYTDRDHHHNDRASFDSSGTGRQQVDNALYEIRRRPYRPTCGIGAYHRRDQHHRTVKWICRELWAHLDADGRTAAQLLVATAEAAAND